MSVHNCGSEALQRLSQQKAAGLIVDTLHAPTQSHNNNLLGSQPLNAWEISSESDPHSPTPEEEEDEQEEENKRESEEEREHRSPSEKATYISKRLYNFQQQELPFLAIAQLPTQARAYARSQSRAQWAVNTERYALYHQWRIHA